MDDRPAAYETSIADLSFLPTLSLPNSRAAETIRSLRTRVMAQHVQPGHRALAICAASDNVGCTFVAANLAVSLSQSGANTLLIDGDMHKPAIDQIFKRPKDGNGLKQYLTTLGSGFGDYIEHDVLPSLSVLFAGGVAPNAAEILASDRFHRLLDFCLREFDATIIDTPPANSSSDVSRIANVVSYCLIVARRNISLVDDLSVLGDQLRANQAHVIGSVFNL